MVKSNIKIRVITETRLYFQSKTAILKYIHADWGYGFVVSLDVEDLQILIIENTFFLVIVRMCKLMVNVHLYKLLFLFNVLYIRYFTRVNYLYSGVMVLYPHPIVSGHRLLYKTNANIIYENTQQKYLNDDRNYFCFDFEMQSFIRRSSRI